MDLQKSQILALVDSLPDDIRSDADRAFETKKVQARMLPFFKAVAELASSHVLLPAADPHERLAGFYKLVSHAERLWADAVALFVAGSYPTALFLAIVALEELGKVAIAKIQAVLGTPMSATVQGVGKSRSLLRSHPKKHLLALAAGAVVNSRLDRLVGMDRVVGFIEKAELGGLERLRQDCLYYDLEDGRQHLPYDEVTRTETEFALVLVGELLAEVGSIETHEWKRLLAKVEAFEKRHTWLGTLNP
jgi:AbiV family abortive infection protein